MLGQEREQEEGVVCSPGGCILRQLGLPELGLPCRSWGCPAGAGATGAGAALLALGLLVLGLPELGLQGCRPVSGSVPGRQVQIGALGGVRDLMTQGGWAFPVVTKCTPLTVSLLSTLV